MLQSSLSDLMHNAEINSPGICSVIAVPKEGIETMPTLLTLMLNTSAEPKSDFFVEEIILKSGYSWFNVSEQFKINMEMQEEPEETTQGKLLTYTVSAPLPNDNFARGKVIRAYDNREFVLIVKERTGAWRVIGSKEHGAVFTSSLQTGTVRTGSNRQNCGFTWQAGNRAYYVEAFPLLQYYQLRGLQDHSEYFRLITDESVMIIAGNGERSFHPTATGTVNTILKNIYANNFYYRVYHRGLAKTVNVEGDGDTVNTDLYEFIGTLPAAIETLGVQINKLTGIPIGTGLSALKIVVGYQNEFIDSELEAQMEILDTIGNSNGIYNVTAQSPSVTPTSDMITRKAALEAKGWSVSY